MARINIHTRFISAIAFMLLASSCSKSANFEENYSTAKSNASSGAGADYDRQLSAQLNGIPGLPRAISTCLGGDVSQTSAHGYFEIKSSTDYKLILEPKGKLSDCLTQTFEGQTLPAPPTTPYLNAFEFGIAP